MSFDSIFPNLKQFKSVNLSYISVNKFHMFSQFLLMLKVFNLIILFHLSEFQRYFVTLNCLPQSLESVNLPFHFLNLIILLMFIINFKLTFKIYTYLKLLILSFLFKIKFLLLQFKSHIFISYFQIRILSYQSCCLFNTYLRCEKISLMCQRC